jgi:hypothetical protein
MQQQEGFIGYDACLHQSRMEGAVMKGATEDFMYLTLGEDRFLVNE